MPPQDFLRVANNFYTSKGVESRVDRINLDAELINYFNKNQKIGEKKFKIAFVYICLNPLYWEYAPAMVQGARQMFLPGHNTDFFFWTDIPQSVFEINYKIGETWKIHGRDLNDPNTAKGLQDISGAVFNLRSQKDVKIFPIEGIDWPYPTLLRYNLFLQQEQILEKYDYIFYCDVDMRFEGIVGDEILGQGITAAVHPGYHIRKEYWPPYEPNPESASYIKRPGRIIDDTTMGQLNGKKRFMPLYFAGGLQGGKSKSFIKAMKACKKLIDKDLTKNYIPIWNDETVWNKYLSTHPPDVVLTPSYIYPDSLIEEYYVPLWGQRYQPRLVTLTKWFSLSKGTGDLQKMIQETKPLK